MTDPAPAATGQQAQAHGIAAPFRPIAELVPYARNARTHTPQQVEEIVRSIEHFGWTNPVLADNAGIVAGHGRVLGAERIYARGGVIRLPDGRPLPPGTAPVIDCTGWSQDQRRAYILADNQLALNAGWDADLLSVELDELRDSGFDLDLIGFDRQYLNDLIGTPNLPPGSQNVSNGSLADKFLLPPFSVLNAREGWWQERKRAWLALGIKSELGRGGSAATPPHPPTVTQNADGTLNYGGTAGQAERFDRQRQPNATPGGSMMPAADSKNKARGDGRGRAVRKAA